MYAEFRQAKVAADALNAKAEPGVVYDVVPAARNRWDVRKVRVS